MSIKEFAEVIKSNIESRTDCEVTINSVLKNNGTKLHGLVVHESDSNIAPTIYLEAYYEKYKNGCCIDELVKMIMRTFEECRKPEGINLDFFNEFDKVQESIYCKLINYDANTELLSELPHIKYLDLAVVFFYRLDNEGTITINNKMAGMWGVEAEELFNISIKNTQLNTPMVIRPIMDILKSINPETESTMFDADIPMLVVSNTTQLFGATSLLFTEAFKNFESDLIIIPSSLHELIVIPIYDDCNLDYIKAMVEEVNNTQLNPEEVLSYNVYLYKKATNEIVIA